MLLFPLADAARHAGLHRLFPTAFAWLTDPANRAIADGRHAICGEDLFVIAQRGTTTDPATQRFESHRRYIDIQVSLSGGEVIEWTSVTGLRMQNEFTIDADIGFYHPSPRPVTRLALLPDHAAVFFPEDAHKPTLHLGATVAPFHKLVFKVAVAAR